jgi:hypothetical protein
MRKKISLNNQEIEYEVKNSRRARRLRVAIHCDATMVVTVPRGFTIGDLDKFLQQKADWILSKIAYFKKFENKIKIPSGAGEYKKHKNEARKFIIGRIEEINRIYNFSYGSISVRNQKTRWGSCTQKGNLNFNFKLLFLPTDLADYVIAHELCHLKEFNHSRNFWNLVALSTPRFKSKRKKLKSDYLL